MLQRIPYNCIRFTISRPNLTLVYPKHRTCKTNTIIVMVSILPITLVIQTIHYR